MSIIMDVGHLPTIDKKYEKKKFKNKITKTVFKVTFNNSFVKK